MNIKVLVNRKLGQIVEYRTMPLAKEFNRVEDVEPFEVVSIKGVKKGSVVQVEYSAGNLELYIPLDGEIYPPMEIANV